MDKKKSKNKTLSQNDVKRAVTMTRKEVIRTIPRGYGIAETQIAKEWVTMTLDKLEEKVRSVEKRNSKNLKKWEQKKAAKKTTQANQNL